jgi:flagellar hook assembly protein FlgD
VLDSYGRTIFNIANNELLGASGFFRWDGNASDGSKARIGYYMVKVEVFDATGVVRVFKKRLAIASRF